MNMEKTFNPEHLENHWYQFWEKSGFFKPQHNEQSYCIMLPPPNVTGTLHMGHAFQDTLMDTLIRYHRMRGFQTLWQGGTDHAGIATQMVVERKLAHEGKSRHDMGREALVEKVWEWKAHSGNTISEQMRRLGASMDWSRERFTMDDGLSDAVKKVFVSLYDEGLIYRGKRLVNWDPTLQTAISDLEVSTEEEAGFLWHIRYPLEESTDHIVIATTRPETLLGDVAVAVNPDDARFAHLVGKMLSLPLCDRTIPIIADPMVEMDFGTGCVKITPAHDFADNEMGKKHQLPLINILAPDATLNDSVPAPYRNMDRFKAREKIVEDLTTLGLMEKIEPYQIKIPRGDRSRDILEPLLTDQWFVKVETLAEKALEAVRGGKTQFVPENWTQTFYHWMENIQDWCISRQIWWGHRIPAWYDAKGNIYVGETLDSVREKYKLADDLPLTQDNDVLDTWFSSALWPFSTLGWPENTAELQKYYPTNVLVTGFDIIFFWVARMMMFGLKFMDEVPFNTVYVHGLILDPDGQKMSKSKGNIIDPIDIIDGISLEALIEKRTKDLMQPQMAKKITQQTKKHFPDGIAKYGTDPLRFTLCALATTNRFIRFDLARVEGYRHFCNKLWNASRYVLMQCENKSCGTNDSDRNFTLADQWILSLWQNTKAKLATYYDEYRFDLLAQTLYEFTWDQFCDWYLELSKPILNDPKLVKEQNATRYTLLYILDELLKALHPLIPYITEEIWHKLPNVQAEHSIMQTAYPEPETHLVNPKAESTIQLIKDFIVGIRNIRGEMNIAPSKAITVLYQGEPKECDSIQDNQALIQTLAKVSELKAVKENELIPDAATQVIGPLKLHIPLAGLIDHEAEEKRLAKAIQKLDKEIIQAQGKLNNKSYVERAPADIVEKERQKLAQAIDSKTVLEQTLDKIRALAT